MKVADFSLYEVKTLGKANIGDIPAENYRIVCVWNKKTNAIYTLDEALGHTTLRAAIDQVMCGLEYYDSKITLDHRK